MPTSIHEIDDDLAGRISSQRDLRAALRQIEEL